MDHISFAVISIALAVALFLSMLVFLELGRRVSLRQQRKLGPESRSGVGVVDTAVFSLLALLIGFAFSGATTRFDYRRELIIKEADAMSTAWQRVDMLPPAQQIEIRNDFRKYVDGLIAVYRLPPQTAEERRQRAELSKAENDLWAHSVAAVKREDGEIARMLLLPSLNEMFDLVETERVNQRMHPPFVIYIMIAITALAGALFAGYGITKDATPRNWLFILGVPVTIALACYVILELESPRLGLVVADTMDRTLVEIRASMD